MICKICVVNFAKSPLRSGISIYLFRKLQIFISFCFVNYSKPTKYLVLTYSFVEIISGHISRYLVGRLFK